MKKLVGICVCFLLMGQLQAQSVLKHSVYLNGDLLAGNYVAGELGLNYVYQGKFAVKVSYIGADRKAISTPDDFSTGLIGALTLGLFEPRDEMESYSFQIGRIFATGKQEKACYNISFGVVYSKLNEFTNWQKINTAGVAWNYSYDKYKADRIGVILNPRIEILAGRFFGVTFSSTLLVNKDRCFIGVGVGVMGGILRGRLQAK